LSEGAVFNEAQTDAITSWHNRYYEVATETRW